MTSLRDSILQADDLADEIVPVPEWDTKVLVRTMDGAQRGRVLKLIQSDDPAANAAVLILVALDPDTGEPIFDPADKDTLQGKSGAVVERIVLAAIRLSGGSVDDAEAEVAEDPTFVGA